MPPRDIISGGRLDLQIGEPLKLKTLLVHVIIHDFKSIISSFSTFSQQLFWW